MIAKCIAVLAVVVQINAAGCGCGISSVVVPSSGSSSVSSPSVFVSGNSGFGDSSSSPVTRNLVACGKYPVALKNSGPAPDPRIQVTTSHVQAPLQEKPTVRLPARIPSPRTVAHSCTCYKTILRPRVHQQIITVPTVQRYIETSHKPVVENIQYEALPVSTGNSGSGVQFVQLNSGSSSSSPIELVSLGSSGSQMHTVEIPTVQLPQIQTVQPVQSIQTVQPVQTVQSVQPVQTIQIPQIQTVQIPQAVTFGSCACQ